MTPAGSAGAPGCASPWTAAARSGFRRHRSHAARARRRVPDRQPRRVGHRRASASGGPAPPSSRSSTGTRTGRGGDLGHPAGSAAPRLPEIGTGLVVGGQGPPPARGRARRRARVHLPDLAGGLLAGPHRRARRHCSPRCSPWPATAAARRWSTSTPAPGSSPSRWPTRWARRDRSSPSSGTPAPAPTPGTTAPRSPTCASCEAEVTPELVASARRPSRHRRARPGPRGCRHRRHAGPRRPRRDRAHADLRVVRPGVVRTRRTGPPRRGLGPHRAARLRHLPHDRARGARRRAGAPGDAT